MVKPWSDDEVKLLKKLARNKTKREIAGILGRSTRAVEKKLSIIRSKKVQRPAFPPWSKTEIKILKRLFPFKTARQIAEQIGRSALGVERKAQLLGLKKVYPWRESDFKLIRKLYPHRKSQDIANKLGRSLAAVYRKAHLMGLKKPLFSQSSWSEKEVELLKKLFPRHRTKELADKLGRTFASVAQKAHSIGLKKLNNPRWTEEEKKLFKKLFPHSKPEKIAEKLVRPLSSVKTRIYRMRQRQRAEKGRTSLKRKK